MGAFPFKVKPIIGQEAICPHGLGRVSAFKDDFPEQWIEVETYINNTSCQWSEARVELIDPRPTVCTCCCPLPDIDNLILPINEKG